jgi:hypothetical protein
MIKAWNMRWTEHVARMRRRGIHIRYCWEVQKEREHYKDLDINDRMFSKWILEIYDGVECTGLIWLGVGTSGGLL